MNDLLVLVGATEKRASQRHYFERLKRSGIDTHFEQLAAFPNMNGGGTLRYKLDSIEEQAQRFGHYEKLIITDAFDVFFLGSKTDVLAKIPSDYVLFGAERNCYPEPALADQISGDTPWRFYNGGLLAGTPDSFLRWIAESRSHPLFPSYVDSLDQAFYNRLLATQQATSFKIDNRTELFYCLFGEQGELGFDYGMPVNRLCNTHPNFLHFNGKWPKHPTYQLYEMSL